jgi:CBS-domain-containing membrane protein
MDAVSTSKPFFDLTANDIMSRHVNCISHHMSLSAAAHLLSRDHITGAPVVDADGRCIGVISAMDFVRWAEDQERVAAGPMRFIHSWEMLDYDILPPEEVGNYMTHDPVLARPDTGIVELARTMLAVDIHRLIVVDERQRPIGVVSITDMLAAVVQAGSGRRRHLNDERVSRSSRFP